MYIAPLVSLLRSLDYWFVIAGSYKHSAPTELTRLVAAQATLRPQWLIRLYDTSRNTDQSTRCARRLAKERRGAFAPMETQSGRTHHRAGYIHIGIWMGHRRSGRRQGHWHFVSDFRGGGTSGRHGPDARDV